MRFSGKRGVIITLISLVLLNVLPTRISAQQASQGLEISPPLIEVKADPGKKVTFQIRIRNITTTTLVTKGVIDDFVADGEDGQAKLLLDKNAEPSPYSFKTWAAPVADLRLVSQEAKTATITLNVPQDAAPGGHYGVVRFSGVAPDQEENGVALSASIGSLVLVNVSGDVTHKATLSDFFTSQQGKRKGFFETGPVTFTERLHNEGSVHTKPTGTVRVTSWRGKEVGVLTVNDKGGNVLPASTRKFEQNLGKKWLFGRYKAAVNIQYDGQTVSRTITFWVIPYKLILIVLAVLLVLGFLFIKGLKRYNRHIVKKASGKK